MSRLRSALKYALPLALVLSIGVLSTQSAKAEWDYIGSNEDGSASLYYNTENGSMAVVIEKDGKYGVYLNDAVAAAMWEKLSGHGNPDPNDPNNGKGTEKTDFEALMKSLKGAHWEAKVNPEDTPLGGVINGGGGGKVPHWNPGDDDNHGPGSPPDRGPNDDQIAKRKAAELAALNQAVRDAGNIKGGMFDGSEGGTEGPPDPTKHAGHGGSNNQGGNDDNDGGNSGSKPDVPKGEDLGPKPELVNPNPEMRNGVAGKGKTIGAGKTKTTNLGNSDGKTGKTDNNGGKTDKTAGGNSLMSPGLLEGGGGFNFNGPSGAGNAVGSAARRTH